MYSVFWHHYLFDQNVYYAINGSFEPQGGFEQISRSVDQTELENAHLYIIFTFTWNGMPNNSEINIEDDLVENVFVAPKKIKTYE